MRQPAIHPAWVFVAVAFQFGAVASAAPVDFVLDPARSTFRLGGTFNGTALVPQASGTDVTGYAGTLAVDLDRSAGTVSFDAAGPDALGQVADQQPLSDGGQVANYGLMIAGPQPTYLAVRGLDLYVRADDAPLGTANPTTTQVGFFVNGGTLYYATPTNPTGGADLHGYGGGGDRTVGAVSLTREGSFEVLTIPIQTRFTPYTGEGGDEIAFTLAGQLVATRLVPEPGAPAALLGLAVLMTRRRR